MIAGNTNILHFNVRLLLLFSVLLCNAYVIIAQEIIVPLEPAQSPGQGILNNPSEAVLYFKDTNNNLDKFVGNWLYDDGTHYLAIEIIKSEHNAIGLQGDFAFNDNDFEDYIYVKLEYHFEGDVKYNENNRVRISGRSMLNANKVRLIYNEPSLISCYRRKNAKLVLEHIINFPNQQLIWTRENRVTESFSIFKCPDGSEYDRSDFIIPENLVLTKQ